MKIIVDTAVEVFVNVVPLTDDGDFKTRETAVAYNAAGMDLVWNFVTPAGAVTQTAVTPTTGGTYDWAHVGDGMYKIEIPASGGASINNDTEGYGWFSGLATGVLPWVSPTYEFVPANIANSLVTGSDKLEADTVQFGGSNGTFASGIPAVNSTQLSGDATAADNAEAFFDGTGYAGTNNVIPLVTTTTTATNVTTVNGLAANVITASSIAADAIGASELAADAVAEIQSGLSTLTQANIRTAVGLASADLDTQLAALPTAGENADAVWEEAIADHSGTAGSTAEALGAAGSAGDPWSTALPGAYSSGQAGKIVGDNLNATVGSRATQTSVDDLPTNAELSTALASADDAVLAAIAALNNLSQANIRTAIGLGSANLDTQLADLPTNAELATALAAADDAILAAVAALNNLSAAQVNAEVDQALADVGLTTTVTGRVDAAVSTRATPAQVATELATYDGPTNAEMEARTRPTAEYATAEELAKVPRVGTTHRHTQIAADEGDKSADVAITEAT